MKLKLCLSKNVLIFYSILSLLIIPASLYNLIGGLLLNKNDTVYIGAFSLFGFVLLPLGLLNTYRKNLCIITNNGINIGLAEYKFSVYRASIQEKFIPKKDRPIFSVFKETYSYLAIHELATNKLVSQHDLSVFKKDIAKIKQALA